MFKKIIAPVIITIIIVSIQIAYTLFIAFNETIPLLLSIFLEAIFIGGIILCISVLMERVREIKKGEEDDLSKY